MAPNGQCNAHSYCREKKNQNTSYRGASTPIIKSSDPSNALYNRSNTWHAPSIRARPQSHTVRENHSVKNTELAQFIRGATIRKTHSHILRAIESTEKGTLDSLLDEIIAGSVSQESVEAQDMISDSSIIAGPLSKMSSENPFAKTARSNPFGAPSQPIASSNPFASYSTPSLNAGTGGFGAASQPVEMLKPPINNSPFGKPSIFPTSSKKVEDPATSTLSNPFKAFSETAQSAENVTLNRSAPFGAPSTTHSTTRFGAPKPAIPQRKETPAMFGPPKTAVPHKKVTFAATPSSSRPDPKSRHMATKSAPTSSALALNINQHLKNENVVAPQWPRSPGDPNQKGVMETLWHAFKAYRSKVRATLIRAGLVDDPDIPKKLSDAIDFKGTCEDMCPEFEQITRIMESDVRGPEKEVGPNGSLIPCRSKMVKALARSAAGQDAPLPMDIRSTAALRRTVDYLFDTVLGDEEGKLPSVHGYLWDRTRAVRRDFVFHSSMSSSELMDQVYCLERITRFHVTSLHLMSDSNSESHLFDEQQEGEQLSKSLLSLIHAYEDCQAKGVTCENEAEFRAYYLLYNAEEPNILEMAQDWGWEFWGESEVVKLAITFVETLQNTWDKHGPLNPSSATEVAQNGFSRFFAIVKDDSVSYTMACFAENYFNKVREAALFTLYESYRALGTPTKDWTPAKLNQYLCFDDEEEVIEYVENYGLHFDQVAGQTYLAIGPAGTFSSSSSLKHAYSHSLVERKRGTHSLLTVINTTVYQTPDDTKNIGEATGTNFDELPEVDTVGLTNHNTFGHTPKVPATSSFAVSPFKPIFCGTNISTQPSLLSSKLPSQTTSTLQAPLFKSAPLSQATPTPQPPLFSLAPPSNAEPVSQFSFPKSASPLEITDAAQVIAPPQFPAPFQPTTSEVATPPADQTRPKLPFQPEDKVDDTYQKLPLPPPSITGTSGTLSVPPPHVFTPQKPAASQTVLPQIVQARQQASQAVPLEPITKSVQRISKPPGPSAQEVRDAQLDGVANWYVLGHGGIIDQITAKWAAQAAKQACLEFMKEKAEQAEQERKEKAQFLADEFRYRFLATKFCEKWRMTTRDNYLKRRARFARKARQEMARNAQAAKVARSANLVEDFKASTTKSRRPSLESLLDRTGVLNGVRNSEEEIRAIVRDEIKSNTHVKQRQQTNLRRSRTEHLNTTPSNKSPIGNNSSVAKHKRGGADDPLRRSLFSDPSYLSGESRTLHMKGKYDALDDTRQPYNGVETDYFRLKARGIKTMPDGRPLATSVARMLQQKGSLESLTSEKAEEKRKSSFSSSTPEIESALARARAKLAGGDKKRKSSIDAEDVELFARAKRVREEMEADSEWYRSETKRFSSSREQSSPAFPS